MVTLVNQLSAQFPDLNFSPSNSFYWSPSEQTVFFADKGNEADAWTLLHETSHGLLGHTNFNSDYDLINIEIDAWQHAKQLAEQLGLTPIDNEHIEDCLDTYRDWLNKRCRCPNCDVESLQDSPQSYKCFNCNQSWQVTQNRHCRHYRARKTS